MPGLQSFRNNDVERLANGFRRAEPENADGPRIPQPDDAFAVANDDGIRGSVQNAIRYALAQFVGFSGHGNTTPATD